jgi:hypothetical protein
MDRPRDIELLDAAIARIEARLKTRLIGKRRRTLLLNSLKALRELRSLLVVERKLH